MIIVKLLGGLGNQMFQYALGKSLALRNNTKLFLDEKDLLDHSQPHVNRDFELSVFSLSPRFAKEKDKKEFFHIPQGRWESWKYTLKHKWSHYESIKEYNFGFDETVLSKRGHLYLDGYWQSEKYFGQHATIIRQEFAFTSPLASENKNLLSRMQEENSVSIHIRRGDYVNRPETHEFHGICSMAYYRAALDLLQSKTSNLTYYVFSDEPEWVNENFFKDISYVTIAHNKGDKSFEDMRLMSHCKHHIIANSSFSWWGAWLNSTPDKIVIAPKNWFKNPSINAKDIVPENWITL